MDEELIKLLDKLIEKAWELGKNNMPIDKIKETKEYKDIEKEIEEEEFGAVLIGTLF